MFVDEITNSSYCENSDKNPCTADGYKNCRMDYENNQDFPTIITNKISYKCDCDHLGQGLR